MSSVSHEAVLLAMVGVVASAVSILGLVVRKLLQSQADDLHQRLTQPADEEAATDD